MKSFALFSRIFPKVGLSRAGCVSACMFKEFQISASFEGLIETVPGVDLSLLKMDRWTAYGEASKREFNDKNGPTKLKTGGTGIKQLRQDGGDVCHQVQQQFK